MSQNKKKQQTDLAYLKEASDVLTKLDLNFRFDSLTIEVIWFRLMEKLEKEWVIERHTHATYELHLITSGACVVSLDDYSFTINAGEFYVTKPGEYHEQRSVENQSLVEYCLNFNLTCHDNLDEEAMIIEALLSKSQCKSIKDTEGLPVLFTDSLIEAKLQKLGYFNLIKNNVYQMIMKLGRQLALNQIDGYEVPVKYRTDEFRLKQIQQFIERNCRSNLTTNDVATYINLSEKQICRVIKKQMGITTKQLINEVRFNQAKQLLKDPNLSVKQVAYLMGFSSEYYFNQFFKSIEGCPPGRYHEVF